MINSIDPASVRQVELCVGPNSNTILENGMAFTIEPGIYISGLGGVRIEDVVVLEDGKARVISKASKIDKLEV